MIKGAYSDKYKVAQNEHIERIKEQAKLEGRNIQDRVKELSKETNRRRKALENKKKQLEEEQEKQREQLLAERRKLKDEATQKFQRESLHRKRGRPSSGKESAQTGSPQLQDGVRIVRGHVVELKNGQQITRTVPTLEDALRLVNSPYQDLKDHDIQYYGPKDMYQDIGDVHTKIGTLSAQNMNQGQIVTGISGPQNPYSYGVDPFVATSNYSNQGTSSYHDNDGNEVDHEEQIRLRESALQNGGPKFAFMNEWTDGALPQTMGRHSPSGSLTSLDSLDEVPSDNLVTKETPCPSGPVAGIIAKDTRTKSAARRRVTFSDSIEFDDGLTGQLVTAEKGSCKQYVKWYNSRVAASNAYNASTCNPPRPAGPVASVKGVQNGGMAGTPGNTPMKSNGSPSLQSGSSASMIVPKSIYSQIPFSGNNTVATTGEATSSSTTHTDHPAQCVAQVEPRTPSVPRPHGQYGTSSLGTRDAEYQSNEAEADEVNQLLEVKDSLDVVRDSLEYTEEQDSPQQEVHEAKNEPVKQESISKGQTHAKMGCHEEFEPTILGGTHDEFRHVDYYGHPTNIYRNPFGQKISTEEASRTNTTTMGNITSDGSSTQLYSTGSGVTHALGLGSSGQLERGSGNGSNWGQDQTTAQEKPISKSTSKESMSSGNESRAGANNSTYYRSWYPGSFFPSKPHEDKEGEMNDGGDDEVFEAMGYTKKNNSVAYDLMDDQKALKRPDQRKKPSISRQVAQTKDSLGTNGSNIHTYSTVDQQTRDRDRFGGTGYPVRNPQADYTTSGYEVKSQTDSKRTVSTQSTAYPTSTTGSTLRGDYNDAGNRHQKPVSPAGHGMTAKPPHPSTRHKGVVYSSPLHRKRAAAAIRHHAGKISPRNSGRKTNRTVVKRKEDSPDRNVRNQKTQRGSSKSGRKNGAKKAAGAESDDDDDEMIQNIKRDMERISMRCNASPAQEEHQKMINSINFRGQIDSPLGKQTLDQTDSNPIDAYTKSDFRSVYKKVHQPRVGSAKLRGQKTTPNKVPPSKIPTYIGTSGNGPARAGVMGKEDDSNSPTMYTTPTRLADQGVSADTNELLHPQTTNLKRSISLDKTPTDDEINILWDRVRNCLNHKETQSVGSDSCVNRIDVRRSQNKQFVPQGSQDHTLGNPDVSRDRSASIAGAGTIGGLRRYGSHEVLRRYGSADNLGYRPQPLLQQRAQRVRQSGQGKPPMVPRQQMNFSPMASKQAPTVSLSTRAAPIPLTQTELRAVMKASQQTQEHLFRQHYEATPEQTQGYQPFFSTRKAPSALSIEENRLLESLDRLNERLKVQEAITANLTQKRTHSANPSTRTTPKHQRASSSTTRYK